MFRFLPRRSLRHFSTSSARSNEAPTEPKDFRPPWVYTLSGVASNVSIFGVMVYAIFFYDFGNDEHVFQPVRRWVARQKASIFALSPAEEKLIEAEKRKAEANDLSKNGS
ncbi:hypothetical protein BT96DRAFT_913287 [Gymnopus androsaceus JB14]|uniref:Uncharacterized protein n=1 Tax=Gymnopus androsaceus JB14 TaxID=1447944 RepID=A0A6A4III0_9AGAR|nr:hypothetical protein BT96DRAFT_913287 [Gymnopus androsaceus JB14]